MPLGGPGLVASFGCLLTAAFNSVAPVRGLVDPNYVGYGFGLLQADKGIAVSLLAGVVFVAGAASALIAASKSSGRELWVVAVTCAAFLVINGLPTLGTALTDPGANVIQLGEYLIIPGLLATPILILLLVVPFAVGVVWAPRAGSVILRGRPGCRGGRRRGAGSRGR